MYDRLGANYEAYTRGGGAGPGGVNWEDILRNMGGFGGGRAGAAGGGTGGFENFADLFGQMFNQAEGVARSAGSLEQEVEISLQEAFKGATRILSKGGTDIEVKIPAGVKTGSKVRVRGQGQRLRNGTTGDLMLVVNVLPDAAYERKDDDLHADLKVDCFTAMLGGEVVAATMSGSVVVKVPAGSNSGKMIRLRNRGMPKLQHANDFGDLYLRVMVTVPSELSDDQRKTLARIAQSLQR
jgi:curved DNA-binding protein